MPFCHWQAACTFFMSDAHHGINSSTQKYQSTQSSVVLTTCRQDRRFTSFLKQALFSKDGMYSGREFQMRAADGTKVRAPNSQIIVITVNY